jgi:signal transduction histidine kinase
MVNSKKHGNENRIEIRISEDEKNRYIEFINDGNLPSSFVPSGGLKVSEDRIISLNGIVEYNANDVFKIKITVRKE